MTTPSRPLSYDSSKYVIQYLPLDQRLNIRLRCSQLRAADSVVPLKVKTLQMDSLSWRLDQIEYRLCLKGDRYEEEAHLIGSNKILMVNHNSMTTVKFSLKTYRDLPTRQSFLMHKLLGGRSVPIVFDNFELKKNNGIDYPYDMQQDFCFPTDMKMKVRNLEVYRVDEQVIQQLTTHIIGDPLRSFRVLHIEAPLTPLSNYALIQNAHILKLPMSAVPIFYSESLPAVRHIEIIMNNEPCGIQQSYSFPVARLILARQESNIESWANMTIRTIEWSRKAVLKELLRNPQSREAVIDDVENNLFNIPCVRLPMAESKELVVYETPGATENAVLKIRVMPEGSARVKE